MARIMVVGGGTWQRPIVKKAREMGNYILCSNLYEDSPAFEYSDEVMVADVLDKQRNLEIAKQFKPDAILTDQTDIAVPTVAYIAEYLGLKGIGVDVAKRFTNKFLMREYAARAGIPVPQYKLCHTEEAAIAFLEKVNVAIIKPIDSQSSRGIHIVRSESEIRKYYADCIQFSNSEKAILIEEYIDGTEFTVDGVKTSTEYIVLAISEKEHYVTNPNVASRLLFTNTSDKYDYDRLRRENEELILDMGLPFGLTHTEYKYKDGKFYLIETAARGGGTKISSDVVKLISGIDSNQLYLDMLTNKPEKVVKEKHYEAVVLGFFDFKPGKVTAISGVEDAELIEGIHEIGLEINVGDDIGSPDDDRSRCGYYIAFANNLEELKKIEDSLKSTLRVETK